MEGHPEIDTDLIESIRGLLRNHKYIQAAESVDKIRVDLDPTDPINVEFQLLKAKVFGSFGVGRNQEGYHIYVRL
ncbi:MAG: hypothetical protein ACXAE3_16265, partial [Candidatus Kariarchaeaceae archaeon]